MIKVAASVLCANFAHLDDEIKSVEPITDWVHYDVMDGHFVNNISFGYGILGDLREITDHFIDVHMMISNPLKYVDQFIEAGADLITFHIEALNSKKEIRNLIKHIKDQGVFVGISIKPGTRYKEVIPYLNDIDLVLVMSVEPGFGGQKFIDEVVYKIGELYKLKEDYNFMIEVDGGINEETVKLCKGSDVVVTGNYLFKAENRKDAIQLLRDNFDKVSQ